MNKEDYVSLEVAKLLKEKGFDEDCMAFYTRDGLFECNSYINTNVLKHPTPTLYEAQKWLRKEHGIHIIITPKYNNSYCIVEYSYRIIAHTSLVFECEGKLSPDVYEVYEQCLNAGILEALKLI